VSQVAIRDLQQAAVIMREALKDRSYRATPLGLEVARYYRWKKNEWGATADTMRDYEAILARLALFHADLELTDLSPPVGTERLRECWDHYWSEASPRTRAKVRSVWVDFFDWAVRERGLHGNPARALASPKKRDVQRDPFSQGFVEKIIAEQTYMADRLGCRLILEYALRRAELGRIQISHFDLERKRLVVTGKGGRVRLVPIVSDAFWRDLGVLTLEASLTPDSYLLYRRDTRKIRMGLEEDWTQADEILDLGKGVKVAYRQRILYDHSEPLEPRSVHTWWYRCLERAGEVAKGVRAGAGMHRGRHTVATKILRETGNIVAAQKLLGHESIETTVRSYAQFDDADLERVLREVHEEA
jgi:site-specific recombinase XerC